MDVNCPRCNKLLDIIDRKPLSCDRCKTSNQAMVFCTQCDHDGEFLCEGCNHIHSIQCSEHRIVRLNMQPSFGIHKPWKTKEIINPNGSKGEPWGVAVSKTGSLWAVADNTNHCVHVFDISRDDQKIIGTAESGTNRFNSPEGVAFDDENNLYVADCLNHRVQRINLTNSTFLHFGTKGSGNGQLDSPHGIATHNDKLYVADTENGRVSVFCISSLTFYSTFGKQQLGRPHDIAVNNQAQLLVVDYNLHYIFIFTPQGDLVKTIGGPGSQKGQLSYAYGIAVDINGFIYVADSMNHRVSVFDRDGNSTECFGSLGSEDGHFNMPCGIAVASDMVYVSDRYNKRVQMFKQSSQFNSLFYYLSICALVLVFGYFMVDMRTG